MQRMALEFEYAQGDHRVWGRLAESLRFIEGREAESQDAYQRAAELAEENLRVNESDWRTTGLLGLYYSHLGRTTKSMQLVSRTLSLSPESALAHYYQALVELNAGDRNGALDALEKAVAKDGEYRQFVAWDPDLQQLRDSERFTALLPDAGE